MTTSPATSCRSYFTLTKELAAMECLSTSGAFELVVLTTVCLILIARFGVNERNKLLIPGIRFFPET